MSQVVIYVQHRTLDMWQAESPSLPGRIGQASTLEGALAPLKVALQQQLEARRKGRKGGEFEDFEVVLYSQPLRRRTAPVALAVAC